MHTTASSEDTEITLGVGKLLGLFFLLAAICAVFFSIGYSLGHSSGREQAANDQVQVNPSTDATSAASASGDKPSAAVTAKNESQPADSNAANAASPQNNLTFYKAVQQNDSATGPAATAQKPAPPGTQKILEASAPKTPSSTAPPAASGAEVVSPNTPATASGTIVIQIAALTREDDAVSLAGALRKKNYSVFVVNNPANNDKFYHVQVGPFSNMADAEAMKAKLITEGYNPIIKR